MKRGEFLKMIGMGAAGAVIPDSLLSQERIHSPEDIRKEIEIGRAALESGEYLRSRFAIGALFYTQEYLDSLGTKPDREPHEEILYALHQTITPTDRRNYLDYLNTLAEPLLNAPQAKAPIIDTAALDFGIEKEGDIIHQNAIDVFAPNGTTVQSPVGLLILLAETGWHPDDPLSTTSPYGGNVVLAYDPRERAFWRIAHLSGAAVEPGEITRAGSPLGCIGDSGRNAQRPGHSEHVHVEIHHFQDDFSGNTHLTRDELKEKLNE